MSVRIRYISIRKLSWHREESPRSYLRLFSLIRLLVLLSGGGFLFYSSLSGFEPSLILIFRARIGGLLTNQGERALGRCMIHGFSFWMNLVSPGVSRVAANTSNCPLLRSLRFR